MAQLFQNNGNRGKFLLHCRPRLMFHLGHLKMLNILYKILGDGNEVTILIIPYDEHENKNQTIKNRLQEEISLTKSFYKNYLGYSEPQLNIVSAYDLDISNTRLNEIQKKYSDLYSEGAANVKKLIAEKNRAWASPNILFVPKCIAAIEILNPDFLICGEKHEIIADSFEEILKSLGHNYISYKFENFKDLFLKEAMDRTDSVHSYIEVNDNYDFILQKLFLIKEQEIKSKWLEHFIAQIFEKAPERTKTGINHVHRTDSEKEIALNKFLINVRFLIPYVIDSETKKIKVVWADEILNNISDYHRIRIERIAKSAYRNKNLSQITIQRIFSSGKSGSFVFEVREFETEDAYIISNVSILKVGNYDELIREFNLYDQLINPRKTAAFMAISSKSVSIDNYVGILYQEASHYLGISKQDRIYTIQKLFRVSPISQNLIRKKLEVLFNSHLNEVLYKHGGLVEAGTIKQYYNELLPSEYKIEVDSFEKNDGVSQSDVTNGKQSIFRSEVEITEVDLREKMARAYTIDSHTKIDIILNGDETLLNGISLSKGKKIKLRGLIKSDRAKFYSSILEKLDIKKENGLLILNEKIKIHDTISRIDDLVSKEYYNFQVSPVHGDLHSGNVLFGKDHFGIIDYGKMRRKFPSFYDITYLLADLKIKELLKHFSIQSIFECESMIHRRRFFSGYKFFNKKLEIFDIFEYQNLPVELKSKGDENLFYGALTLTYLAMLKFDLEPEYKKAALIYSHFSFLKIKK